MLKKMRLGVVVLAITASVTPVVCAAASADIRVVERGTGKTCAVIPDPRIMVAEVGKC